MTFTPGFENQSTECSRRGAKLFALVLLLGGVLAGCGGSGQFRAPEALPDDRRHTQKPKEREVNILADGFDNQIAKQIEQSLDLSRQLRRLFGRRKEAMNVNAFDEVSNSSWFTNRNVRRRMSVEEIARGPNRGQGPDTSGIWIVFRTKAEGVTPGFHIQDSRGVRYVIKFDPIGYPELTTGAEVVSTKLFYAAGHNVPENYVVYFHPRILSLGKKVKIIDKNGRKRFMTEWDLEEILERVHHLPDGRIRALASRYIPGIPIGPFKYSSTRKDDPNDIIPHKHRRELRGLRMLAAWLNHFDTKANNTYDSYVTEGGRSYVRHYLIDFGSTLGSGAKGPTRRRVGHENSIDPQEILRNFVTVGFYVRPWEKQGGFQYPSIGLYESSLFQPQKYKFHIPNLAFENMTDLDGYWGAKVVMSFTDEQLKAAVAEGKYSNPEAAEYLLQTLIERRDIVGRYWFSKVNPLDQFELTDEGSDEPMLHFRDLAVNEGVADAEDNYYRVVVHLPDGRSKAPFVIENSTSLELPRADSEKPPSTDGAIYRVELRTRRGSEGRWSKRVWVYIAYKGIEDGYELVGVEHET